VFKEAAADVELRQCENSALFGQRNIDLVDDSGAALHYRNHPKYAVPFLNTSKRPVDAANLLKYHERHAYDGQLLDE
jgi:hypothetical protein